MFHACESTQRDNDQNGQKFTCSICNMTFGTICQLHDHFDKCSQDDSYIFYNKHKVVFPLSSLWALTETSNFSRVIGLILKPSVEPNGILGNHQASLIELLSELYHRCSSPRGLSHEKQDGKDCKNVPTNTNDLEPAGRERDKLIDCSEGITAEKPTVNRKEGKRRPSYKKVGKDSAKLRMIKQKLHNKLVVNTGILTQYSLGMCLNPVSEGVGNDENLQVGNFSIVKNECEDSVSVNDEHYASDNGLKKAQDNYMNGEVSIKSQPASLILTETDVEGSVTLINNNIPLKIENDESCEVTIPEVKLELASDSEIDLIEKDKEILTDTTEKGKEILTDTIEKGKEILTDTIEKGTEILDNVPLKKKAPRRKKGTSKGTLKLQRSQRTLNPSKKQRKKSSDSILTKKQQSIKSENSSVKKKCGPTRIECLICGRKVRNMEYHMVSHSDSHPYKCEVCPKAYKYPFHLATHMKSHSDVLPYYCEICGQGFIESSRLRMHSFTHTDYRPHKCEVCDAGFVTRTMLKRHMLVHTGVKKMQCHLCGMSFSRRDYLTVHISSVHKKERRFSCEDCGKTFITNYQLKCHAMKHSGLRPYKCQLCKSDYIERKELRRHMKKQHNMLLDNKSAFSTLDQMETDQSVNENSAESHPAEIFTQSGVNNESVSTSLPSPCGLNEEVDGTKSISSDQT